MGAVGLAKERRRVRSQKIRRRGTGNGELGLAMEEGIGRQDRHSLRDHLAPASKPCFGSCTGLGCPCVRL